MFQGGSKKGFQQSKGSELVQHTCDVDSDHPEDKESPWPFAQLRRPEPGRGNIGNRDEEQCDASNGDDDDDGGEDDDDGHGPGNSNPAHSASTVKVLTVMITSDS